MNDRVVIDRRFNGPPNSANGGYACGLVGTVVKAPAVRVSLRKPPPLDVALLRRRASRRLGFPAQRRRCDRHGRARRRAGAGPAGADGRAGRDRDAQVRGLRAPQVPDGAPSAGRRATTACGSTPVALETAPSSLPRGRQVDLCCLRGRCSTARARTRSSPSTTALRSLSSRRSPSSSVRGGGRRAARRRRLAGRQRRLQAPLGFGALRRGGTRPRCCRCPLDRAARPRRFRRLSRPSARACGASRGLLRCPAVITAPCAGRAARHDGSLLGHEAAVDGHGHRGHERGGIRAQPDDGLGNLRRRADPPDRLQRGAAPRPRRPRRRSDRSSLCR